MEAAHNGDWRAVRALLDAGADRLAQVTRGWWRCLVPATVAGCSSARSCFSLSRLLVVVFHMTTRRCRHMVGSVVSYTFAESRWRHCRHIRCYSRLYWMFAASD